MATAKATTDHDEIRKWVEARGGRPARVIATGSRKDPGILRIDFPGFSGEDSLEEIEWDEFFDWFDRNNLAALLSSARGNRFNKLVDRATAGASSGRKRAAAKKSSSKKPGAKKSSSKKSSSRRVVKSSSKKAAASATKRSSAKKSSSSSTKSSGKKAASSTKRSASKKSTRRLSTKKSTKKPAARKSTSSITTTDHDEIRNWVESRGGFPAHVKRTGRARKDPGVLRIDYPGFSGGDSLERMEWDDWFDAFEKNKLAFLYQNKRNSRFSKLVER